MSEHIYIPKPIDKETEIQKGLSVIESKILTFTIGSVEDYQQAGLQLKGVKGMMKEVKALFDPMIKSAKAAKAKFQEPLDKAETHYKRIMVAFTDAEEVKRRAEEVRLQEIARKEEEDRRVAEAVQLEKDGEKEAAQELIDQPAPALPPVVLPPAAPKIKGISYRVDWKFEILDPAKIPREYLCPDERKIGGVVRSMKADTFIPGVKHFPVKTAISGTLG